MRSTIERTDTHVVKLTVEVLPEDFASDLERTYRELARRVRVPGFRAGKVPRRIIDAQVGKDAVFQEFLSDAVPVYYRDAVREHDLAPIGDPDVDIERAEEGEPLVFTATMEVRPRVTLEEGDYKGIEVERPVPEVADAEVDQLVDRLRDRFAELESVGHPARRGDFVVADFRGTVHGEELPEASATDYLYEVGSGEFGEKLDAELEGKRSGEIVKANAPLPERFGERAGQEISFQVLVKEVKGKKLPDADDDFAKQASEFDTMEEFRTDLRRKLEENKEREADAAVRDLVLQKLIDGLDVELPESLVDHETQHRVEAATERAQRAGLTLQQMLEAQGWDELRLRADAREHAIRAIKADLVLEAVARAEELEVTPEEIAREIEQLAALYGREPKEVAEALDRSGQVVALAGDIIRSKALDVLVEHADIRSEDGSAVPRTDEAAVPDETSAPSQEDLAEES